MTRSNNDIIEGFKRIDKIIASQANKNKEGLSNAKLKPFHHLFPFSQNGICPFIAGVGRGKTFNYLKLAAQQQEIFDKPIFEHVVICSTSGEFDETVNTFKTIINKSKLRIISDDDLLPFLENHIEKSLLHKTIMKFVKNNFKNPNEKMLEIIERNRLNKKEKLLEFITKALIDIGWEDYPSRMLLILDDFASHPSLKKRDSPLPKLLKKLRHFNINVFICVQNVKLVTKDLKRDLQDLVLFPGISEEDFIDLMRETGATSVLGYKELWENYRKIKDPQSQFRIHIIAKRVIIIL